MQLGNLVLNISSFFSTLWIWINQLFTVSFNFGGVEITLWSIFVGLGVSVFITIVIVRLFT